MKKLLAFGIASLAAVGAVGAASVGVSALGGYGNGDHTGAGYGSGAQTSLEARAGALDMTADQLRDQLQTKTMSQIAVDQGLTEEQYQANMQTAAEARWQERGVSSEEIAERTAEREQRQASTDDCEFGTGEGTRQNSYGRS